VSVVSYVHLSFMSLPQVHCLRLVRDLLLGIALYLSPNPTQYWAEVCGSHMDSVAPKFADQWIQERGASSSSFRAAVHVWQSS